MQCPRCVGYDRFTAKATISNSIVDPCEDCVCWECRDEITRLRAEVERLTRIATDAQNAKAAALIELAGERCARWERETKREALEAARKEIR